ncbi:MAG: YcbK family protein [Thermoanaerobaculia bacterium]
MDHGAPLFPEPPKRHRIHRGLTERQEHIFTWLAVIFVLLYGTAWVAAISQIHEQQRAPTTFGDPANVPAVAPTTPVASVTGNIFGAVAPKTPALNEALLEFLDPLRGESGELRYVPTLPGEQISQNAPPGAKAVIEGGSGEDLSAPDKSGIYKFAVEINKASRAINDLSIVTLVPRSEKRSGRIGSYFLGSWPWEAGGTPRSDRYAPPSGFIEVTRDNQDFQVSEHFKLRDFLTKDQPNVWPKYLLLDPLLIDKLELTIQELERQGVRVDRVFVMSGFRTPRYNHSGGNTAGRASLSRHMYGDAADVYVDNNADGFPDDITGDGRVTVKDAERMAQAAEIVERRYPRLVGGIGVYVACCGHGPFTHIDVRGVRARWRGTGNG